MGVARGFHDVTANTQLSFASRAPAVETIGKDHREREERTMTALARRALVTSIVGLPLATILTDPRLAAMAAETLETVSTTTAGGRKVSAALAVPTKTPAPSVLLVHEWWGLNDQMKTMAAEFAKEGFLALAVDLFDGQVAKDPTTAQNLMNSVDPAKATDTLNAWVAWLRKDSRSTGKVGT